MTPEIPNAQPSGLSTQHSEFTCRFSPLLTLLSGLVLFGCLIFLIELHLSVPPVDRVVSPERALPLMVGRTMELEEALADAPALERWLYAMTADTGADERAHAIAWYEELARSSDQPVVQLQLAVLVAEAGQQDRVRRMNHEWMHRADPFPSYRRLIHAAYVEPQLDVIDERALQAELAEAVPAGWFYDRLAIHLAERAGDTALLTASRLSLATRAAQILWRIRILTIVEFVLIFVGLISVAMLMARRQGSACFAIGKAPLPPPWRGRVGAVVLLRGGAAGVLITIAFLFLDVESPWLRLSAMPMATIPLLLMAQRHLFGPAGLDMSTGLGLLPAVRSGWLRLALAVMALLAAGLLGEWGLGVLADRLDLSSHWTEWFDADLVWGSGMVLIGSLLEFVVFAPIFEEIVFRGLLFGTLRRKYGWNGSAICSAALFASAHGYGALGFFSVFWSGMLWAWMYEKTGSLLPGICAHALNNLLVCVTIMWLLR